MVEQAVINASPLIFFARSAHLDILMHFADQLLVPSAVADEILVRSSDDPTAKVLRSVPWISVVAASPIPQVILDWGLGKGESAVLGIALASEGMEAIIDDLAARKCARCIGVPVRGTLGIVLSARKREIIGAAR